MARVEIRGAEKLKRTLNRLGDRAPQVVASMLTEEAERIMAESKTFTPVDTGALRASGHVKPPQVKRGDVSVTLAYGGAAAPYAVFVHEDLTKRHNPPTQAKYLERPFKAAQRGMLGRFARRLRRELLRRF